ncbi:hypothetical protein [Amycolatopsis tolypomycina]|uniref:hypothetical protein n=1 Tax=Amycolatopsis tolypomycina TaxID=208445 RepID=UPI00339F690B
MPGDGLALRYMAPFGASLATGITQWTLTTELAGRWARALLTLAAELNHAHTVVDRAILAQHTGLAPPQDVRGLAGRAESRADGRPEAPRRRVRGVLADKERVAREETLIAAFDLARLGSTTWPAAGR